MKEPIYDAEAEKDHEILLDGLTEYLEKSIPNFVLEKTEDLIDTESGGITVRAMWWNRGEKTHIVVISPYGQFKHIAPGTPINLVQQIVNQNVSTMWQFLGIEYDDVGMEMDDEENHLLT